MDPISAFDRCTRTVTRACRRAVDQTFKRGAEPQRTSLIEDMGLRRERTLAIGRILSPRLLLAAALAVAAAALFT